MRESRPTATFYPALLGIEVNDVPSSITTFIFKDFIAKYGMCKASVFEVDPV